METIGSSDPGIHQIQNDLQLLALANNAGSLFALDRQNEARAREILLSNTDGTHITEAQAILSQAIRNKLNIAATVAFVDTQLELLCCPNPE